MQKTNPDIKIFIDYFFQEYQKFFGRKYVVANGKDGEAVKRALQTLTLDELKSMLPEFFNDPLDWMGEKPNRTISVFVSQINRYGLNNEKISAKTRQQLQGLADWYAKGEKK